MHSVSVHLEGIYSSLFIKDLPKLKNFSIGEKSFEDTTTVVLRSTDGLRVLMVDVPFNKGKYTVAPNKAGACGDANQSFHFITESNANAVDSDPSMMKV